MSDSEQQNFISVKRITFSERFEKTRLAILSYSAIAIVLSVASNHSAAQAPGVTGVHINIAIVRILVMLAAAAYMFVFWKWDVPATNTLNSNALDGVTWSNLTNRLRAIETDVVSRVKATEEGFYAYDNLQQEFSDIIKRVRGNLSQMERFEIIERTADLAERDAHHEWSIRKGIAPTDRLGVTKKPSFYLTREMETVLKEMKGVLDASALLKFPDQRSEIVSRIESVQTKQSALVKDTLSRLQELSSSLMPGEAARFRFWDCGAAYGIFIVAALMTLVSTIMYAKGIEFVWNDAVPAVPAR